MLEPDTALVAAELALAEARRVARTEADVLDGVDGEVGTGTGCKGQIMGESPLKELSRRHARAALAGAQRALEAGGGPRYFRHLLLERWVLAELGGKDPAEAAGVAGVFGCGAGEGGEGVDEGVMRQLEGMQRLFWGGLMGGAGAGSGSAGMV